MAKHQHVFSRLCAELSLRGELQPNGAFHAFGDEAELRRLGRHLWVRFGVSPLRVEQEGQQWLSIHPQVVRKHSGEVA